MMKRAAKSKLPELIESFFRQRLVGCGFHGIVNTCSTGT